MQVHKIYPAPRENSFWRRNRQDLLRSLFLVISYTCLLVNLLTGGMAWSLIAIGGLCIVWIAFIYRPMVEHTLIKKLSDISVSVCLYLLLLGVVLGGNWSRFAATIVFFAEILAMGSFYLLFFKKQKRNFMPLFELLLTGMITVLWILLRSHTLTWGEIVLGSVSLGLLILTAVFFPKEIWLEIRKKMHR